MPQDAFHIRRLTHELNSLLTGGKINRISQVDKDELTFIIYTGKSTVKLIVSANATTARVCLSASEKEPAPVPPNFCMLLRKHLQGAEILSIKQHGEDRIVEICLHCTTDFSQCNRVLICEIMGKYSNVVLTEKGIILGALKTTGLTDENHRVLLAGAKYEYPAPQDKLSPLNGESMRKDFEDFARLRPEGWDGDALAKRLFERVAGLALPTAREIVKRAETINGSATLCLSPFAKQPLWNFTPFFFENEPNCPHLKKERGLATEFFAFEIDGGEKMPSLCKAEDEFYSSRENKKRFEDKKRKLESGIRALKRKASKRLQDILERLKDAEKADENRIKGELLTANLYAVEKGTTGVELDNWYDEKGGKIKIALDPTLSPSKNAQKYFKQYNKQKRAKEILTPMKKAEEEELFYADSIFSAVALAETQTDLKEIETELIQNGFLQAPKIRAGGKKTKQTPPVPFREYQHDGYKIFVGRNNLQNDRLVRTASPDDIWLHTQKYHSSHVIIATQGEQVRDETILFAAQLCAYYSEGQGADKIPVDYCKKKYVKKPSKSKAGFVVYTNYKTVLVTPDAHKDNQL